MNDQGLSNQIQDSSSTEGECQETEYWSSDIEELTEFFFEDFEDIYEEANTICYDAYEEYIQSTNEETYGDQGTEQ